MTLNMSYHNLDTVIKNLNIFREQYKLINTIKVNQKRGIYNVYDNNDNKYYVLKFILRENITNEQKKIFNFFLKNVHSNFCKIIKIFEVNIFFIIVMEYIEGITLCNFFNKKHKKEEYNKILFELIISLDYLHNNKIMHGDIKPNNIIINLSGNPIIIDYDLSKFVDGDKYTKHIFGTKLFISPEMINKNIFSIKSDIWSLGMTFYICIIKYYDNTLLNSDVNTNMLSLFSKNIKDDYGNLFYNTLKIMLIKDEKLRPTSKQLYNIIKNSKYYIKSSISNN